MVYVKIGKKQEERGLKMDKDTKIELLKILAMVIVLILLIVGIVWMNKEPSSENETSNNS